MSPEKPLVASQQTTEGIAILGVPRSGTTLLRRLIDAHPEIACPGETSVLNACARFLQSETIEGGTELGVLGGLGFAGFTEEEVLERLREFAFSFHREHARRRGKARWAEKTAFDIFYLDAIERIFGEHLKFICLFRHGLDTCCSLRDLCDKNGGYLREIHEYIRSYPRPLEAFARLWSEHSEALLRFAAAHPKNAISVRYEDLIAKPEEVLEGIFGFLGETWTPSLLRNALTDPGDVGLGDWKTYATQKIELGSVGRWKELPAQTRDSLAPIVNPALAACGYEAVPTRSDQPAVDSDREATRRRYEVGLLVNAMRNASESGDGSEKAPGAPL